MGIPPLIEVSTLGMSDTLILMVLALMVFGPRRLPQIGRQLGKLMYEFRKASNDFKFQMEEELRTAEEADRRKREEEDRKRLTLEAPAEGVSATAEVSDLHDARPLRAAAEEAESGLQVRPPSIGETVAAERPGARFAEEPAAQEGGSTELQPQSGEVQPEEPAQVADEPAPSATEAVSHNG
ncbi:MAG: twin-arginine translocase TatA/TatE family subunit [Terracidiphilus sp.]